MNNNAKLICGTFAGFIIGSLTIVGANQAIQAIQNTEIKISLNGQVQEFKDETTGETQYPITYNDRTYLPLRNVAQLAGLNVDYDSTTNTALLNSIQTDINYFDTNSIHSREVGERTGKPETYFFTDDNKYSWSADSSIVDYTDERVISSYGTWKIESGNLILNELVQEYREGGEFVIPSKEEQEADGLANVPYFTNAKNVMKKVNNTYTKELTFIGKFENGKGGYSNKYLLDDVVFYTNAKSCDVENAKNNINQMLNN